MQVEPNNTNHIPPPAWVDGRVVVPVDMERLTARVRFDVAAKVAQVSAVAEFVVEGYSGCPAFDLRQVIDSATFDGQPVPADALAHADLGAGPEARMRAVDIACDSGSPHRLETRYRLAAPDATASLPVDWALSGDAVRWDLWMSDLEPGRYLEMWFPANLCHDRVSIEISVEVAGTVRPHRLLANGTVVEHQPGCHWTIRYPATYTALSPLLVLAPADEVEIVRTTARASGRELLVTVAKLAGADGDPGGVLSDTAAWLSYFGARYGAWAHGDEFLAVLFGAPRGMEYDGATTASEPAVEHEIFHSWFGRGVKPARASDGWMDEAMAIWATTSRRVPGRYAVEELGLDQPPSLLCPPHPWSRYTPREAYTAGNRLLAGVAHMAGGEAALRSALADWHRSYAGSGATTEDLLRHLSTWCGRELSPWWDRYVYGRG